MSDKVKIFALGGLDEDGKSCLVVEVNDEIYVVSCGINYPDRTMPGVDYLIPDFTYLKENKDRVKAYLLPHGHDDEMGGLVYIYNEVPAPVYASRATLMMLETFARHVGANVKFDEHVVEASSSFYIGARRFYFFQTSHNIAQSSGIAISTSLGNVVITSDFVIENNATSAYKTDLNMIAKVAENPTLVLLPESLYASRPGYTAPKYKLTPLIEQEVKDAPGRVFVALYGSNFYNVDELVSLAIASHKRIVPYDEDTADMLKAMQASEQIAIPRDNFAPFDDINRYRAQELIVLMLGFGTRLFRKIALLAAGQSERIRPIFLDANDAFIIACPANDNTEIEATDALDELYRSGCHVHSLGKKEFYRMHASEEDLKMMISLLHPKYYIPVKGYFKDMLASAENSLSMGGYLNHNSVFLMENGTVVHFDEHGAKLVPNEVPHGDIMIDGIGVGDVGSAVLSEREKLKQGVVVMAVTIDPKTRKIVAGPDIQFRGLVMMGDSDALMRDVTKAFNETLKEGLDDPKMSLEEVQSSLYDHCSRLIRRQSGKEPMVLPIIVQRP
jgi:ribonuclease J